MLHISHTAAILAQRPYQATEELRNAPQRKSLACPSDRGTFIRPLKQCFIRNPRLMPMTRLALSLLAGWAGHGGLIQTTIGIIARHLRRSRRQVFRYLRDAAEEGYLYYSKTKDRIGRYTGISIRLNFSAIRHEKQGKRTATESKTAKTLEVTQESDTKAKILISMPNEEGFQRRLAAICRRNGIDPPSSTSL
ncbi:hypothetical protein M4951_16595 [Blastopirellula sp. J2-11]|uniref:hypothetical protein n=1 Tax=Blastopirellula sp. J2-11 TaxID=2943192 RepID=UPI0021C58A54|nr:hypothetical protein [Blastopirellula sp. J2-11]UUO04999.1 hypothetical protein M4951_16595 [Blastopirellula sp. J2-11]